MPEPTLASRRLKRLRFQKGVTCDDVARATGLASSTVSKLEQGYNPHPATAKKIADYFGVDPAWLFLDDEPEPADDLERVA